MLRFLEVKTAGVYFTFLIRKRVFFGGVMKREALENIMMTQDIRGRMTEMMLGGLRQWNAEISSIKLIKTPRV